jgi:NADPH:quinone reductase-like Zn-dependent oxidoreductase
MTGFVRGDEVYGTSNGSFAQYARARAGRVAPRPVNLSFEQVAGRPGFRARRPAGRARPRADPGRPAGADYRRIRRRRSAVQIAKAFGAEVTGMCSTAKADLVRTIAADHVIDYTREDAADGQHRYDVSLDIGGNRRLSHLRRALTPRGRLLIAGGETCGRWLDGTDRVSVHICCPHW